MTLPYSISRIIDYLLLISLIMFVSGSTQLAIADPDVTIMKACNDGGGWNRTACAKACKPLASELDTLSHAAEDTCKVALSFSEAQSFNGRLCTALTCKYKLKRVHPGDGIRGDYSGEGLSMHVFDVGSPRNGTMTMVASLKAGSLAFRFEAFCGSGQCEGFKQKVGARSQISFFPDGAVFKTSKTTQ